MRAARRCSVSLSAHRSAAARSGGPRAASAGGTAVGCGSVASGRAGDGEDGVRRMGHCTGSAAVPQCAVCICVYVDTPYPRAEPQRPGDGVPCRPRGNGAWCDGMRNVLLREAADESGSPSPLTAIPPLRGCGTTTT